MLCFQISAEPNKLAKYSNITLSVITSSNGCSSVLIIKAFWYNKIKQFTKLKLVHNFKKIIKEDRTHNCWHGITWFFHVFRTYAHKILHFLSRIMFPLYCTFIPSQGDTWHGEQSPPSFHCSDGGVDSWDPRQTDCPTLYCQTNQWTIHLNMTMWLSHCLYAQSYMDKLIQYRGKTVYSYTVMKVCLHLEK